MSLELSINDQLKTAMKAKDEVTLRSLRAIKAAILVAKTSEGAGGVLKAEDETKLLQKLVTKYISLYLLQSLYMCPQCLL